MQFVIHPLRTLMNICIYIFVTLLTAKTKNVFLNFCYAY